MGSIGTVLGAALGSLGNFTNPLVNSIIALSGGTPKVPFPPTTP
ncbi:hypothetical protein [Prescottella equi]|nr:hypothetical protein [Prescottella equi]